jgi:hypothetical protein
MTQRSAIRANSYRDECCGANQYFPGLFRRCLVYNWASNGKNQRVDSPDTPLRFDSSFPTPMLALEKCTYALGSELQ